MLEDLTISRRKNVCTMKADLTCPNRLYILKNLDVHTFRRGLRDLLSVAPSFLLLDETMLDEVLSFCIETSDIKNYSKLLKIKELSLNEQQRLIDHYLEMDYLKRGYCYSLDEYSEMLQTDDDLLQEENFDIVLSSETCLNSIRYVKTVFADYYEKDVMANHYLMTLLKIIENEQLAGFETVSSIKRMFQKTNSMIVPFQKRK